MLNRLNKRRLKNIIFNHKFTLFPNNKSSIMNFCDKKKIEEIEEKEEKEEKEDKFGKILN